MKSNHNHALRYYRIQRTPRHYYQLPGDSGYRARRPVVVVALAVVTAIVMGAGALAALLWWLNC